VLPPQFFSKTLATSTAPTELHSLKDNALPVNQDANFALLTIATNALPDLNLEETNASRNADLDMLLEETNASHALIPTALSATLKTNALPARYLIYSILMVVVSMTVKTELTKTSLTKDVSIARKDANFAKEKDNAHNALKDYYFTMVYASKNAPMVSLLLKLNALLAKTETVRNAVKLLTAVMNARFPFNSSMLNVFLNAPKELTYKREDAENVILNARNAKTTKLASDANLNSTSTTENARLLALVEKFLLTENVSLALTRTARTA
jgi:hypothetical protein